MWCVGVGVCAGRWCLERRMLQKPCKFPAVFEHSEGKMTGKRGPGASATPDISPSSPWWPSSGFSVSWGKRQEAMKGAWWECSVFGKLEKISFPPPVPGCPKKASDGVWRTRKMKCYRKTFVCIVLWERYSPKSSDKAKLFKIDCDVWKMLKKLFYAVSADAFKCQRKK